MQNETKKRKNMKTIIKHFGANAALLPAESITFTTLLAVLAALFCCNQSATAQSVTGKVVDEEQTPVSYVNVVLLNPADSAFVSGTVSGEDGSFSVETAADTPYIIRLSLVGYKSEYRDAVSPKDIGTVVMTAESVSLDEVTVKAQRPSVAIKENAFVTTVAGTYLEHAGSASDVLSYVPMVLGRDGNFTVFGKGSPLIYINNRKLQDTDELKQINSSDIKSIELITNPGPKYDASVKSVIRIITKRPQGDGISGSLRTHDGWQRGHFCTYNYASLKYRIKGLEVFGRFALNNAEYDENGNLDILTRGSKLIEQTSTEKQTDHENYFSGTAGFSYVFNEHHSIGAYYSNGYAKYRTRATTETVAMEDEEVTDNVFGKEHELRNNYPKHYTNIYYDGEIGKLSLDLNVDYMWKKARTDNVYDETGSTSGNTLTNSFTNNRDRMLAEKLVIGYPVWKGTLEIGDELTLSRSSNIYTTDNTMINNVNTRTDEKNIAGFAELKQEFGIFGVAAGLRYEHVKYKYLEDGVINPDQNKTYNNFFPSVSFSADLDDLQLGATYTCKTNRPNYETLDGSVIYFNRFTLKSGNPYLKPETLHTVELNGSWQNIYAQLSYTYTKNAICMYSAPYNGNEDIRLLSYENISGLKSLSFFIGTQLEIGVWQPSFNVGAEKQWLNISYGDGTKKMNSPIITLQWENAIHLPGDIWLNIDAEWTSKGHRQNILFKPTSYVNAKLYKAFFNNRFAITLEANDIFNKTGEDVWLYCKNITASECFSTNNRMYQITLQYTFNSSRDRYRGKGAGQSERQRFGD